MAAPARTRLLASAITLAQREGIATLAVADVLRESGTARQSFYNHFPGGAPQLAVEAVLTAGGWIDSVVADACARPVEEALRTFSASWGQLLVDRDFELGCPVAAGALARSSNPEAADAADAVFAGWESRIATALVRDGIAPEEAEGLACVIVASVEGALTRCLAARSTKPLETVETFLLAAVRAAGRRA